MMKKAEIAKKQLAEKAAAIEEQALEKKRAEEVQAIMPQQQTAPAASSVAPATTAVPAAPAAPAAESAEGFAAAHGLTLEELNAIVDAVNKKKANKKSTSKAAPAAPATSASKPAAPAAPAAPKPAAPAEPAQKAKKVPHTVVSTPASSASAAPAQTASAQAAPAQTASAQAAPASSAPSSTQDDENASLVTIYRVWLPDMSSWLPLKDYAAAKQLGDLIRVSYAWEDSDGNIIRYLEAEELVEVFSLSTMPGLRKGYVCPGCSTPILDVFAALQVVNFQPNLLTQVWGIYGENGLLDHFINPQEAGSMLP